MASIKLLKDYAHARNGVATRHKAGEVISVPYGLGLDLVAAGTGRHWNGGAVDVPEPAPAPGPRAAPPAPQPRAKQAKPPAEAKAAEAKPSDQGE